MFITLDPAQLALFKEKLNSSDDAYAISSDGYSIDLYDASPPSTLEIELGNDGAYVLAAVSLLYDDVMDGWYLGERISNATTVRNLLFAWLDI